jgi:hypothetical protein
MKNGDKTKLPDTLKAGIENLSGISMDDVNVHVNSPKPAQLKASACSEGTEVHFASGQEEHVPHESWHVVQQRQGKVQPVLQKKDGVTVNDDTILEQEADRMGNKAMGKT